MNEKRLGGQLIGAINNREITMRSKYWGTSTGRQTYRQTQTHRQAQT